MGHTVTPSWWKNCAIRRKVAASLPNIATEIHHWLKSGVKSDACKNEYQQYFLGVESDQCIGLTNLPLSCANCLEFCETSRKYKDCWTFVPWKCVHTKCSQDLYPLRFYVHAGRRSYQEYYLLNSVRWGTNIERGVFFNFTNITNSFWWKFKIPILSFF